jgi:hypothetical protein
VQDWTTCRARLDEAMKLDPSGETDPRVVEARKLLPPVDANAPPVPSVPLKAPKPP